MPVEWERDTGTTVLWGMVSGLFSLAANLLLIEAMRRQSVGVCSTIFRLNLVAVVIGACWLLDETLTVFQGCGVVFAVRNKTYISLTIRSCGAVKLTRSNTIAVMRRHKKLKRNFS